ncbi:hypothetical protein ACET3X_002225 [Alternaria dauci]|uniref:Helicase C-terminal domain-containing protein n=1 Tax=Alternaria dauci TaxID=48095 RepID=A0ABR3UP33_9PLEO
MPSEKLIVIVGATGNQGGSVATVFLEEPGWKVRALTRDPSSTKSQALAARGAEVVQANMDIPESLSAAFVGANAIFAVSDFWGQYFDPSNKDKARPGQSLNAWVGEHETQQLKNMIDAAAKVPTLERFILSSLSNATKWSKGKYTHVYHFDSKAKAEEYGKETYPDLWAKTSIYQAGLFLSNYFAGGLSAPIKNSEGVVQFIGHLEKDVKFPFVAAEEDSGPLVKALVLESPGKNLIGYREWLTVQELASSFTKATGMNAEVVTLPKGSFPPSVPTELKETIEDNMAYWNEFGYEGRDDPTVIHPRDLMSPPSLDTVEAYFKKSQDLSSAANEVPIAYPSKLWALLNGIEQAPRKKCIIFSAWKSPLDLTAKLLNGASLRHDRIHGGLSLNQRLKVPNSFKSSLGPNILLMTLGTGAEELNLTVATRIYLPEPQWNPSKVLLSYKRWQERSVLDRPSTGVVCVRYVTEIPLSRATY